MRYSSPNLSNVSDAVPSKIAEVELPVKKDCQTLSLMSLMFNVFLLQTTYHSLEIKILH